MASVSTLCIVQAYQVLSNEKLRMKYDAKQDISSESADFMQSTPFFAMLFGSMRFEEFVGELMISTLARYEGDLSREQVTSCSATELNISDSTEECCWLCDDCCHGGSNHQCLYCRLRRFSSCARKQ
jgi:DnaJ-class molecular chaperone